MIDLRLLRDDPELSVPASGCAASPPTVVDDLLRADEQRRAATQRFEAVRAEQKSLGKQVPQGVRRRAGALLARTKELAAEVKAAEAARPRPTRRCAGPSSPCPTSCRTACPPGGEDDYVVLREVGDMPRHRRPEGPPGARRGAAGDRHRARRQGVGLAVLLPHRRRRAAPARPAADGHRPGGRARLHPVDHAVAGQAGVDGGHRLPRRARQRDLPARGRRPLPGRHVGGAAGRVPLGRDPRPRRPGAVRRLVVVLPPGGRLARQGHPRHPAGAPVRQGRDVLVLPAGAGRRRAPARCSPWRRRCWPRSRCPTG